jgi:hypothetical protein
MTKKNIISIDDDIINIKAFGNCEERRRWDNTIEDRKNSERKKVEEKLKKQLERKSKLKNKLAETKKQKEKKIEQKEHKDLETEKHTSEVKFGKKPSVKSLPKTRKTDSSLTLPLDFEINGKEDLDIKDVISQKILSFHEKYSLLNGGFSQYEKIKDYLQREIDDISEENIKTVLEQLIELKLISDSIKVGKRICYLFREVELSKNELAFIKYAFDKEPLKKDAYKRGLKWNEEKVLDTMKKLQEKGILRIESNTIIIPGIQQKIQE